MALNPTPNRASLLAGLRTGGVRSVTQSIPHTAAPGGSFHIPRIQAQPEEQYAHFSHHPAQNRTIPMTAAVDGGFHHQQSAIPFSPGFPQQPSPAQAQALQMQYLMALQAQQYQQQYQAQLLAAQGVRRPNFNPPATAGPTGSFDLRSATLNAQMRRGQLDEPQTAALDGRFGVRQTHLGPGFMNHFPAEQTLSVPSTPQSSTGVISGGTSLGSPATPASSKSETASNWRRGGNNNSVLRNRPSATMIKSSPPPTERRLSPPPVVLAAAKPRPGLSINSAAAQPVPVVAIDHSDENDDNYSSSSSESAATNSPPTTPRSSSSVDLTHKDAAATKVNIVLGSSPPKGTIILISRQPRGPPSEAAELATRNFASRTVAVVA